MIVEPLPHYKGFNPEYIITLSKGIRLYSCTLQRTLSWETVENEVVAVAMVAAQSLTIINWVLQSDLFHTLTKVNI